MPKIAFVFPGQGSQHVGMGESLSRSFPSSRELFNEADEILGFSISEVCFRGPEDKLKDTRFAQPAIMICSVAAFRQLVASGIEPGAVAGHSLGEYSALIAAEVISFPDGVKAVNARAAAMSEVGRSNPGTMAAVLGLDEEEVISVCERASEKGVVVPANFNSPGQVVISGETSAVESAMTLAREMGAKRCVPLRVSGAFHSPLMKPAENQLASVLDSIPFSPPKYTFVPNVTGEPESSPEEIRSLLVRQLTGAVKWTDSVRSLVREGYDTFVEVGPGKVLSGLISKIDRSLKTVSVETAEDIEKIRGMI